MKLNFDFLAGYKTIIFTVLFIIFLGAEILKGGITKDDFNSILRHQEIILAFLGILYGLFMKWWRNDFDIKNITSHRDTFQGYIGKVQGRFVDYDKAYGSQCVDLAKDYSKNVLGIKLGSFGGSAKSGWKNTNNTFHPKKWKQIANISNNKNQVPKRGDIIFFDGGSFHPEYGHVAIVTEASAGEKSVKVLEQNGGSGNGDGKGENAIRTKSYSYNGVAGWYRKIG